MKKIIAILICSMIFLSCKTTYIYIVRHAEKATSPADNPHLTDEGNNRALALKDLLTGKDIKHVFSTTYNRTMETAAPTATALNLSIESYGNENLSGFAEMVKNLNQNTLIVGHSNTVPQLLTAFGIQETVTIADNEFNNLFVITIEDGKVKGMERKKYGE